MLCFSPLSVLLSPLSNLIFIFFGKGNSWNFIYCSIHVDVKKNGFVHLFIFGLSIFYMLDGLCCCTRASRVAASEDCSCLGAWASHCHGCSCLGAWASHCWLLLSRSASSGRIASAVAARRLRSCDLQALERELSSVALGVAAAEHAESSPTRGGTRVPCAYCKVEFHPLDHQGSPHVYFETWPLCSFFFFFHLFILVGG